MASKNSYPLSNKIKQRKKKLIDPQLDKDIGSATVNKVLAKESQFK